MSADAHEDGVATASGGDAGSQLLQADPVLRVVGLCKRYGHVEALRGADLAVDRGEIVALVGDNGAGKSTFVKAVGGVHEPDSGEIWIDGNRTHFRSPHDARRAGVEVVHQDLALAPDLPVWSNLFLGRPLRVRGPLRGHGGRDGRDEALGVEWPSSSIAVGGGSGLGYASKRSETPGFLAGAAGPAGKDPMQFSSGRPGVTLRHW